MRPYLIVAGFVVCFALYLWYLGAIDFASKPIGTHPFPLAETGSTYAVGAVQIGPMTFPVRCDTADMRRETVIRIFDIRRIDEIPSLGARLGTPAFYAILDGAQGKGKGRIWRLAAEDFIKAKSMPQKGKAYRLVYGRRDVWAACSDIWNVLEFEEIAR